jgi:serine/threonine protein kinase
LIVQCFGLTQNQSNGNYMLVISLFDMDLRKYLQQAQHQFTWKKRIKIIFEITAALGTIHIENAIHRDLHSGNILYQKLNQRLLISDLGFCGPADKPLKSVYGNLPYIAPEVIAGKGYAFASDIYSIGMLMWEISSGQPPFSDHENDYYLAMNIINGIRPKIYQRLIVSIAIHIYKIFAYLYHSSQKFHCANFTRFFRKSMCRYITSNYVRIF